jgi:hypothetical protein
MFKQLFGACASRITHYASRSEASRITNNLLFQKSYVNLAEEPYGDIWFKVVATFVYAVQFMASFPEKKDVMVFVSCAVMSPIVGRGAAGYKTRGNLKDRGIIS